MNPKPVWHPSTFLKLHFLFSFTMSKSNVRRHALEKSMTLKDTQKILNQSFFPKSLKKVYPVGLQKSTSSLSLSSLSLSLSQNSNDSSSQADSLTPLDENISLALRLISVSPRQRREPTAAKTAQQLNTEPGELKRCNWVTKNSGMINIMLFNYFGNFDIALFALKHGFIWLTVSRNFVC